ncbi:MAG: sugar transferase [Cyanobacteriota bacterium]|nr:sugar transferase [Cyanobacteriota bacterium]
MVSQIPEAQFQVTVCEAIPFVKIPDRFTILHADAFKKTCEELFFKEPLPPKIVLDFSKTNFIDSCGIGALVTNVKIAREKSTEIVLQDVSHQIMEVFSLTSLDGVLTIEQSSEEIENPTEKSGSKSSEHLPGTHPSIGSWFKRFIDVVGALVGLGITAILFVPIAIAIKIDSPGPLFFAQTRCGWMGKQFKMWKFRSMGPDAEKLKHTIKNEAKGSFFKNENDPRITTVGRFLRRRSLDELPQFWNVLKGDMSLVGTRPPTADEVESYEVPQWQRLDVKPGMTGEWQVNGRSQIKNFEDVIRLDLKYQENWSLMYDIKLILKTITILFKKNSGAV